MWSFIDFYKSWRHSKQKDASVNRNQHHNKTSRIIAIKCYSCVSFGIKITSAITQNMNSCGF